MGAFALLVLGRLAGVSPVASFHGTPAYLPLLLLMLAMMGWQVCFKLNMHLANPIVSTGVLLTSGYRR